MVGVPVELSDACKDALVPIPVMRVVHLAAAAERIVLTRPLLAVIAEDMGAQQLQQLPGFLELAAGVGCEVLMLAELGDTSAVPANLELRAVAASRRRSGEFAAV